VTPASVRLVIPAEVGQLARVRALIRDALASVDAPPEAVSDLVQAVDESVCNVIEHGYAGRPGSVEVTATSSSTEATVTIRDLAPPFDPTAVPSPDVSAPLAARPLGGMGVHLARTLTDRMVHRILPAGGNELTLVKSLRAPKTE
jgi:serine/threonine-protein kinase RsbW